MFSRSFQSSVKGNLFKALITIVDMADKDASFLPGFIRVRLESGENGFEFGGAKYSRSVLPSVFVEERYLPEGGKETGLFRPDGTQFGWLEHDTNGFVVRFVSWDENGQVVNTSEILEGL